MLHVVLVFDDFHALDELVIIRTCVFCLFCFFYCYIYGCFCSFVLWKVVLNGILNNAYEVLKIG